MTLQTENGWHQVGSGELNRSAIPGTTIIIPLQQGIPSAVMKAFAADYHAYVEPLNQADSGGWTPTNSVRTSNHLSGTAMDLRWNSHPFKVRGTFTAAQMSTIRELLAFYENTIWWGGDWTNPIDEMHWQMGYGTHQNPSVQDFINRKIRLDGFSTFRRGGGNGLSPQTLSAAMLASLPMERYQNLYPFAVDCLRACGCTSLNRIAMWMAQIGHESLGLRYAEEIADGSQYEGRRDLGNLQPGDGRRFKGRSFIQVTGRFNYGKLSQWAYDEKYVPTPTYFLDNPERLSLDAYAFLGVTWYWTVARPNLNALADAEDLPGATKAINGGLNGLEDRRNRWIRARLMGMSALSLPEGEDLTPEQDRILRELHGALFNKVPSQSLYADPGEGSKWAVHELVKNDDGMLHEHRVEELAGMGDQDALKRILRVAAGQGVVKDRWAIDHARAVLSGVPEAYLETYIQGK